MYGITDNIGKYAWDNLKQDEKANMPNDSHFGKLIVVNPVLANASAAIETQFGKLI